MTRRPAIPSVDRVQRQLGGLPEAVRVQAARAAVDLLRDRAMAGEDLAEEDYVQAAREMGRRLAQPSMARALNFSGVILHTGLGRARLAPEAERRIAEVAGSHALVEFERDEGTRGDRQDHVRGLLCRLTGAEDAHVVNNCAAAVMLALTALARDLGVVLSRGEMVEIGGSFRMPEVIAQSGCRLVEVGCTNKTRLSDYEHAVDDQTAVLLRCHPSNFKIVGFAESPSLADLVELAHRRGIVAMDDAGSGLIVDLRKYGLPYRETLADAVASGADVVTASGDKLLGGPQSGIILGRKQVIAQIRKHPLARAFRVDKLTLAGLEATLRLYADGQHERIPVWRAIGRPLSDVRADAKRLAKAARGTIEASQTEVGGGSLPGVGVPTWSARIDGPGEHELARRLRELEPPIVASVRSGAVWLDPRTATPSEVDEACALLEGLF